MMMPANFSAISENEMTYVTGGALVDVLPDALTEKNWKIFNTNMVTLIGNHYVQKLVNMTLGQVFSGSYVPGNVTKTLGASIAASWTRNSGAIGGTNWYNTAAGYGVGALNVGLQIVGGLAAIYNLATASVKNDLPSNI